LEICIYAAALFTIAVFFLIGIRIVSRKLSVSSVTPEPAAASGKRIPCILCGSVLAKGEKLYSKETIREKDSIIHMYGCPHCHGDRSTEKKICPVCRKPMSSDEYLIGRMWLKKNGRKHLHMSGCVRCAGKI